MTKIKIPYRALTFPFVIFAVAALAACGSSATTTATPSATLAANQIRLNEWSVDTQTSQHAGTVNLNITNAGSQQHELLVFKADLDPAQYPKDSNGAVQEDSPQITKISDGDNLAAGGSQSRTVDLTKPGKYLFVCNLTGHFQQGMYTTVNVTP